MTGPPLLHLQHGALDRRALGLRAAGVLDDGDVLVVDAVARRFGEADADVLLGLAFAVRAPRMGHVGVDLRHVRGQVDDERRIRTVDEPAEAGWPEDAAAWEARVLASPMVAEPGGEVRPFVAQRLADGTTLVMTRRMWREQERLADALLALAGGAPDPPVAPDALDAKVQRLFPHDPGGEAARAVRVAAAGRLAVVTGGPGTGKTYSIKRLLALLLEASARPLAVELAAPTGKAAVRMAEAMGEDLDALPGVADATKAQLLGLQPRTLHKLLGLRPDGTARHTAARPLPADVVVVDEASMVDLQRMRQLVEAIPEAGRLVLLGDRDQLASVEAGTVLADIVAGVLDAGEGAPAGPLAGAIAGLRSPHRFGKAERIKEIATGLQRRDDAGLPAVLEAFCRKGDGWLGAPRDGRPDDAQLDALAAPYLAPGEGYAGLLLARLAAHADLRDEALHRRVLEALDRYRVLAVHRRGPLGVAGLERELARRIRGALEDARPGLPARGGHWLGRPLLVTQNAYDVGLMNGDVGLVLPTRAGLAAVFPVRRAGVLEARAVPLAQLPEHAGALALTVHKSQGSQFDRVALVLAGRDSPIQTRELVYTAVTRSKRDLLWLGARDELDRALRRRVARASGLGDLLWRPARPGAAPTGPPIPKG